MNTAARGTHQGLRNKGQSASGGGESPPREFSQDQRREVMKRSPYLTESASIDKVRCQKEEEFPTWWDHAASTGSK